VQVYVNLVKWRDHAFESIMRPSNLFDAVTYGGPRFVFCLNWSLIVPSQLIQASEFVNFHCTDLRRSYGRGGHPIENLLLRGHTETVITAHRMTRDVDAGDVYLQSAPISLAGTKADIQARFVEPVTEMIQHIVEHEPKPVPQVGTPTHFYRLPQAEYDALWAAREQTHG
jgi:methionyl-tRNA formyltransferase